MQKVIGHLINQFKSFYSNLTPVKRASMMTAMVIAAVCVAIIVAMLGGTNHAPLFTNIPPDQVAVVVDRLQKKNIPFILSHDGSTVSVPKNLLPATQMAIMTELGNAEIGTVGLELFEKQDFGVTSYAQRINYQRALQGELIRAVNTLSSVKQTKVILALPPKKTFLEESSDPTASVVIELHAGKSLTQDQVKGITFLVSSSVENLMAEKVTVIDSRGKILSKHYSQESAASAELLEIKGRIERNLEQRVESILSKVVGNGKVIAKINADLNPQQLVMTEETVDPDSTAVRASTTEEELMDGARNNPSGIPGARSNLPGADEQGQIGFRQNVRKELKTTNYAVPKTVKNIKQAAGGITRLSVAILVDGTFKTVTGEDGTQTETWVERSPAELTKYETIVKNAVGFSLKRGDDVKIENIQFQKEDFSESEKLLTTLERKKLLHSLFKWSLLGLSLALFFFIVVRPFMRWVTDSFQEGVEEMLPRTIEELEELQSVDNTLPGMSGALPVLEESIDPDKAESELLRERIMNLMEGDEEKAAGAFSLWLTRKDM